MTQDNIINETGIIKVVGVNQVEIEHKRRRRRRRRRANNKSTTKTTSADSRNFCSAAELFDDDSSTCATVVSFSSDDSSTTTTTITRTSRPQEHHRNQQQQQQQQRKKKNQSSQRRKQQQQTDDENYLLSVEEKARYVALDCEMVGVGQGGIKSSVARVTLVDWDGRIVWDEYIQQEEEVTDYRTFVSGITQFDLENNDVMTFDDCRQKVLILIANKILVGHALKNDLRALHISHPWQATRDTAKYDPFMQIRLGFGFNNDDESSSILWPRKLKQLAFEHLQQRQIQREGEPHSSYEDAAAAMDLYKVVRRKWEKVMDYKIRKTKEIEYNKIFPKLP